MNDVANPYRFQPSEDEVRAAYIEFWLAHGRAPQLVELAATAWQRAKRQHRRRFYRRHAGVE